MHKITDLPTGVVGIADTNPHNEKSAYKTPKVTTVKFKVEIGTTLSVQGANRDNGFVAASPVTDGAEQYSGFGGVDWNN